MTDRLDPANYSEEATRRLASLDTHRISPTVQEVNGVKTPIDLLADIDKAIDFAIDKAPNADNLERHFGGDHTITIKIPDDADLLPALQTQLFCKLGSICGSHKESGLSVNPYLLMGMYPDLPAMTGVKIRGQDIIPETVLGHEFKHAFASYAVGTPVSYIILDFFWNKDKSGNKLLDIDLELFDPNMLSGNYTKDEIHKVARAPRYPSSIDISGGHNPLTVAFMDYIRRFVRLGPILSEEVYVPLLKKWSQSLRENAKK